jgi:hypothetical protein
MKNKLSLVLWVLLVIGASNVYAQSNKLIGTWVSIIGREYTEDPTILTITNDTILIRDPMSGDRSWTWADNNDGMTLTINNELSLYVVTDTILLIELPINEYAGERLRYHYLTRSYTAPVSQLIGKWVMPKITGDLEVTITNDQIIMKRGRQTQTLNCSIDSSNSLSIRDFAKYMFFFLDETHLFIMLPELGSTSVQGYRYILTKQ